MGKAGFPIYLFEPLPAKMRRITDPTHVMKLTSEAKRTQLGYNSREEAKKQSYHRSEDALIEHFCRMERSFMGRHTPSKRGRPTGRELAQAKNFAGTLQHGKRIHG